MVVVAVEVVAVEVVAVEVVDSWFGFQFQCFSFISY